MSLFGKQWRFCPNCGKRHYDERILIDRVHPMCCDAECRKEWDMKYARMVLGKSADPESPPEHG